MTASAFLVSLSSPTESFVSPFIYNGHDSYLIYADTAAIALKMAAARYPGQWAAMWATNGNAIAIAAGADLTGWNLNVKVTSPLGVDKVNVTVGGASGAGVKAALDFTVANTTSMDTQTVTINGKVYTFQTSLTNIDGHVLIGVSATTAAANLFAAITGGAGSGTTYAAATTPPTGVTATNPSGGVVHVSALVAGVAGNSIAVSETCSNSSWAGGAIALAGGIDAASIDSLGTAMATALAALTPTAHASYTTSTDTLIVAAGGSDALGDHKLYVKMIPPSDAGAGISVPGFIGVITQGGVSSDDLKVVLTSANEIPGAVVQLRSENRGG